MSNPIPSTSKQFFDNVAISTFGMTKGEARQKAICVKCKEPAADKCHSAAGQREYEISCICEECFDAMEKL